MTLTDLFDLSLVGRRDRQALEFQGLSYTFGDIDDRSNRMANLMLAKGFATGDRLSVQLVNCVEMIDLFLACVKLGVIFVPVNILYKDRETDHILRDSAPKLFLRQADLAAWTAEAAQQSSVRPRLQSALDGSTPAGIIYTSGTTGTSKGAVLTHNNFAVNALSIVTCWQISEQDRLLLALPLFHVHALGNGIHAWLVSGCRMRLLERFEHQKAPAEFLDFAPTLFFGVPTMYVRLLDFPPEAARTIGSRMRLFVCGSAPLPAQTLEDFRSLYGHTILERYGMSETLMNTGNPFVGERRPGSVGLPFPGVEIEVRDVEGRRAPDGTEGELHLKGGNLFAGYWGREDATRAALTEDGFFRTGDMGFRSPDGYFTLCGRKSDLIISGGFNIYPREIEEFLQEQAGVEEAAVVGQPDRFRGEVPVAYFAGTADPEALEAACRAELASFKVPRRFERLDQLPRNAMGKLVKTGLRNRNAPEASKV